MADLAWHLAEVQHFWASIVADLLPSPESVAALERPADDELASLFIEQTSRLITALESRPPNAECWSWHDEGRTVGWVLRRQAHEALIHRIDAELGAADRTAINDELAADGVDEILRVMLDARGLPAWSAFVADGRTAIIDAADDGLWGMELGRFVGKSPDTGRSYDEPALRLLESVPPNPSVTVRGSGADLDLWLWGRSPAQRLRLSGDHGAVRDIRDAAAAGTQ